MQQEIVYDVNKTEISLDGEISVRLLKKIVLYGIGCENWQK